MAKVGYDTIGVVRTLGGWEMEQSEYYNYFSGDGSLIGLMATNQVLVEGHFKLSAGGCSSIYLDIDRIIAEAGSLATVAKALTQLIFRLDGVNEINGFIGPEHGGAVLAQAVATRFYESKSRPFLLLAAKKIGDNFFIRPTQINLSEIKGS